jgi:hypothetical protein|tara:strand:- start:631 stop:978 length:348 start_codon:yes stop_codon:yes gene_type:complete
MKNVLLLLITFNSLFSYSQEWIIIDVLEQSKKQLIYRIDDGQEVIKKIIKNPSIVKLIKEYQNQGFKLEAVTQGIELDLNGNLPLMNSPNNNFGITNLTLFNNNRVMLWFEKEEN